MSYRRSKPKKARSRAKSPSSSVKATRAMREANAKVFQEFKDADGDDMTGEGVVAMCEQLGIDAGADVEILIIFWRFKASQQAVLTEEEFVSGMTSVGCASIADLKAALPSLKKHAYDPANFKDFFKFVFQISRDGTERTLDVDTALLLLGIVYPDGASKHLVPFSEFLAKSGERRFTFDQWCMYAEFERRVAADVSDYEDDGAWPLVFDDYVEWVQGGKK